MVHALKEKNLLSFLGKQHRLKIWKNMVKDLVLARFLKIVKMNQAVGRTQENM
jgi:hypothetical protein